MTTNRLFDYPIIPFWQRSPNIGELQGITLFKEMFIRSSSDFRYNGSPKGLLLKTSLSDRSKHRLNCLTETRWAVADTSAEYPLRQTEKCVVRRCVSPGQDWNLSVLAFLVPVDPLKTHDSAGSNDSGNNTNPDLARES